MTQEHPIAPPPKLREQWREQWLNTGTEFSFEDWIINCAAQWGADTELKACIAWLDKRIPGYELVPDRLRAARRPKPKSEKQQALEAFDRIEHAPSEAEDFAIILRALKSIPDEQ